MDEEFLNSIRGKRVAIFGDSISTHGDPGTGPMANAPEIEITEQDVGVELCAYVTFYDVKAGLEIAGRKFTEADIGREVTFVPTKSDVGKVIGIPNNYYKNEVPVWWTVAAEKLGFTPIVACWSGCSITSHEKADPIRFCSWGWHPSEIRKCGVRVPGTMKREAPDAIIIYRCTNDFSHPPYTRLTEGYFENPEFSYPKDDYLGTDPKDGSPIYGFLEGLVITVQKLRETYPNAQIFICTPNVFKRVIFDRYPTRNGFNTLPQYARAIRQAADFLGCGVIDFAKDGITFENCYSEGYITDSEVKPTHPGPKGHARMAKQAILDLSRQWVV